MNTNLFNPTKDKYYAIILMRMDARAYTLVNYIYAILKVIWISSILDLVWAGQGNFPVVLPVDPIFQ